MKKKFSLILIFILISNIAFGFLNFKKKNKLSNNEKFKVVTTIFPIYDFTKQIAGDKAEITLILKPGSESHSFDPTPKDMLTISKAKLFIYTSEIMEPWVEKVENSINNKKTIFVESGEGIAEEYESEIHDDHDEDHHAEEMYDDHGHEHGIDPHIWTNPLLAAEMAENILAALIEVDSANSDYYEERAEKFIKELMELDEELDHRLSKLKNRTIVTGGHFAMAYFAERYDLEYISAYEGFAPNAEPKPKDVAKLRDFIKENHINYIYFEELVNPKIAKVLSDEMGVKMLLLHGAHNVSKDELANNITYIEIMKNNLKNLELGLNKNE